MSLPEEGTVKSSSEVIQGRSVGEQLAGQRVEKKQRRAINWDARPDAASQEFKPFFEEVVKTSKTRDEAVQRMGYANPSMVYHHMKRLGIEAPGRWRLKPGVSKMRKDRVPGVVTKEGEERTWVGTLIQERGHLRTHTSRKRSSTALEVGVISTDSAEVFRFSALVGIRAPQKPILRDNRWKPDWVAIVGGLRAHRLLREILPFLKGHKREEAERALEFFAPDGYREGHFGGYDVWPEAQFPERKRGEGHPEAGSRGH